MMTKNFTLPTVARVLAAAVLLLLPAASVCAQNAPDGAPANPARSQQGQPSAAPAQAAPSPAQTAPAKSQPASAPAQATPAKATKSEAAPNAAQQAPAATEPNRAQAYFHAALAGAYEDDAISDGKPEYVNKAIEEYKYALDADPGSAELNDELADLYFRVGRFHDAEVTARAVLKDSPNNIAANKLLGRIYLRQLGEEENGGSSASPSGNALDQAIAEFEKLVALQPKNVEDHMVLGQLYTVKHDSEKAEEQFKSAQAIEPDSEDVVLNLARLYAESGDLPQAVKAIEAVAPDARTAKMEMALGGLYVQLKQPKDAIAAFQRAEGMEPGDLDTTAELAEALLNDDQLDEALKEYQKLADADPENADPLVHIGEIQRRQGKYEEALATIRKARKIDPNNLEGGYNEGMLLDVLGRFDDAVQVYQQMVDLTSHANGAYTADEKNNRGIFLERLGSVYVEENKTDLAVAAYQKMVDMGGSSAAEGYQGQVDAYREAQQFDKALAVARKAAAADPKSRDLKLMLATELADQGHPDEGLAMAKGLLDGATPDEQRGVWFAVAQMNVRLRRWKDAEEALDKAEPLAIKKDDRTYLFFLRGELAERQKHLGPAEQYFRQALDLDPSNAMTLNYLGYMLADKGIRLPEALQFIRKAVNLEPMNGAYLDSLGWVYYKMGEYDLAEDNLRSAVERDQTDPTVHMHLGDLYEKTGRIRLAAAQWELSVAEFAKADPADIEPGDPAKVQKKLESARVKLAKEDRAIAQPKPE